MKFLIWLNKLLGRSDVYFARSLYMKRWKIGPASWPGLRVHKICRSDSDRELHDHPFTFLTIILRGGYYEHLADGSKTWHGPGSILLRSAEVLHRLELKKMYEPVQAGRCEVCDWPLKSDFREGCVPGNCSFRPREGSAEDIRIQERRELLKEERAAWTFVFRGPYRRKWGFVDETVRQGWTPWETFVERRRDEEGVMKRVDKRAYSTESSI